MVAKILRYLQFSPSSHSSFWRFIKHQNGIKIHKDTSKCPCLPYQAFCKIHTSLSLLFQKQQFNNDNDNINTYVSVLQCRELSQANLQRRTLWSNSFQQSNPNYLGLTGGNSKKLGQVKVVPGV
jgi:hypothetical protein